MVPIALAVTTFVAVSIAQALLKHGLNRSGGISLPGDQFLASIQRTLTDPFVLAGFLLVLMVIPLWLAALARLNLSVAYPLASLGFVVAIIIGAVVFKETITPLRMGGMLLIILGVVAIARSQ